MPSPPIRTFSDAIDALVSSLRTKGDGSSLNIGDVKEAVLTAHDVFMSMRSWRYLETSTTISLVASQDEYSLPGDFEGVISPMSLSNSSVQPRYIPPEELLRRVHQGDGTSGTPRRYTVVPDDDNYGRMKLKFYPAPSAEATVQVSYRRHPRWLRHSGKESRDSAGTVGVSGVDVSGTSTQFLDSMVGAVIRFNSGSSQRDYPTGVAGNNPAAAEAVIESVTDGTTLAIESAVNSELTGVKYIISDPIDIPASMYPAFLAIAKGELGLMDESAVRRAVRQAKALDGGIVREPTVVGGHPYRVRLADRDADA